MKTRILSFTIAVIISSVTFGQWSSNPAVNMTVADVAGSQELVKISPTTDGGCYISWFDTRGGSYAVYLQRLNALGVKQFAADGLLISNNPQNSSLVDYDMICDANNNAVIAFTDLRNGGTINPFAYLISPAGTFLWGANGVTLSDSVSAFQPNPKIVATTDGNYIFVWRLGQGPQKIAMQKLNAGGAKQWGSNMVIMTSGTTENYDYPMPIVSDNGGMILMWSGYTGSFITAANYKIYSQKFSSAGARVWNATQDTVYSLGRVSGFYNPRIFTDGNNGAVYCWRDDRNSTNRSTGFIQRKNSAGAIQFPVNGSAVSTNTANNHFDLVAVYVPSSGETFTIYQETNGGQTTNGMFGQRFSSNGTRLWPDAGQQFIPLANNQQSAMWIYAKDTNVICTYEELQFASANYFVNAIRTGPSGVFGWGGNVLDASNVLSAKTRMNAAINSAGMSMLCWADNRMDANGVYAQNINLDGTLGNPVGIININGNVPERFSLMQNYPNPFNPGTNIRFQIANSSDAKLIIYDALGREVSTLVDQKLQPGTYEVSWNASKNSSGIYFYRLAAGDNSEMKKMILIK